GGDREAGPGAVGGGSVPGADAARAPHDAATAGDAGAGSANADVAADMAAAVASDIAATWADVLDVPVGQLGGERGGDAGERAGEANFFALGGDSVAATAACSRLRALGYRVTVAELFGNPTLDRFTDAVVAAGRDAVDDTADHAAADAVDDGADDAAVPGGGADRAGAADGAAGGDADAGAPFPLTPLQRAYALGTDGIRGTVRAATAYAAVLGLDAAAGYGPTRAGFTYPQVKAAAAGIVARWAGLRVVRDGDDAQRVVDPSDALRVTVLDPSTDLRAHLASATPRVPLELVLPGEEARELGVLVDYLALDGRSLAVVVGALTAVLSGEDPDRTVTVDPTVSVFARHCRALAAGGARADAPDGTGTGTASPATPATPPAAAPEPPTLPVAAGQEPSDAGADTPPAAFTSLRAHIPLATLDRAAARTGATVSAVVLAEFGSALAEASGRGEVGVVVPLTHRPDTGDDREILGTFSRLGVCACPATPDPAATRDALAAVLTADGGVRAASAGRTGRYPAVFTSVLGYDAALAPATRAVRAVWSLTRTPGVLVDCQLTSVDAGTVEVRWDMPDGVLDAAAVDAMFRGMVDRLGGTVVPDVAEITGPLPGGYAPLGDVRPPSTVSALLREVIERLDGEAGARDDALVPWAGPVVAAWRRFVAGGPEATGLADAPVAWSARDAQLLVDVVRGRARRFGILAHPVLSPRALAAAEPTVARALDVLDDRVRRRVGRGERVAVVELGHGIARGGRRGGSGGSVPGDAADSWTVVEPDALVADIATVDGRTCVSDVADVPAPADVVVACGTLHRDPRLRAGLGAVRLAPGAEVHVVEAERPTAATLVSAALVNPAVLDAAGMLSARGWAEVVSDAGLRVRYLEAEDGHSVVLRAVAAEDGEPTAGVAGAVAGVGSDAGSTPGSGDAAGDAAGDAPAAGRPATGQVTGRADVTAALAASWRRHLPGLADGAGADGADGAAAGALPADTDFFVAGGDSLTATRVLADLREVGVTGLRAVDVFNNPTFGALRDRAAAAAAPTAGTGVSDGAGTAPAAGTGAPDSRPAAPPTDTAVPPADGHGTHPLTRVQQAYLAGQDSGQLLGGAPARCLFTFRAAAVDTGRLESAVRAAARRHPVLRTVVTEGPAGTPVARVLDDVPAGVWAVTDGTGATGTDAATTGAPDATGTDAAAALAGHVPDPRAEGPLAVRVSTGPDGATVAVSMNNLLLDGASMMLLMDEIAASYADPATRLDAADASTAPGGAAAAPAADPTAGYLADRPWLTDPAAPVPWQGRMLTPAELDGRLDAVLADLPPAPFVPDRRALAGLTDTTMARVAADVDAATWDTVRAGLAARHVTPAAGVLAAFGRALAAETGGDDLTVTLTRFDRDLSVPGIDRALGDFTSLSLAGLRGLRAGDRTVAERSAQTALAEADDPALDALRLTARAVQTSGDPVAGVFPVVFTCGLGLAGATAQVAGDPAGDAAGTAGRSLRERSFGTQVAASSTTPQVVLDLQVADDRDGLHLTADHLVRVLPAAVADRVVRRTVAELTGAPAGDGGRSRTGEGDDATLPRPRPSAAPDAAAGDAAPDAAEAGATDPAAVIAEVWADVLGLDRVTDGTNFFRAGGDSLTATRCITALRARGVDAALRTLLTTPDLGDFRDAVVGAAGRSASTPSPEDTPTPQPDAAAGTLAPAPTPTPTPQPDTPADPAPTPEPAPEDWFDLTDVQAGYLMGRTDAYDDGGVACQGYSEFVLPVDRMDPASAADPAGAVRRAWRRVVDAHEMLRALVDREGRQRIDRTAGAHVRVIDVAAGETGTGVTAPDPATARAIVRDDLRERNFPVGEAPMVELALTVGDGDPVLHLSVDLIVTDYVGIRSLVRDLDHCLRHPSDPLDAPAATFRQCLEARARHAATPAGRAARERDTRWWRDRLDTLPPALTFSPDPDATGLGGTTRRSHRLDADAWRGLRDTAARLTVTPSGLVLAAFATAARRYADIALGGYTHGRAGTAAATGAGTDTATATGATVGDTPPTPAALITLTTVDRAPVGDDGPSAADIGRIVGDFTSTVVLDLPLGADLAPTARDLQGRLFDALDHPAYPGVRVVRDLRRSGGEDRGRIPVVFTSTVGVDAVEPPQLLRAVPGTAISKTPQVLLDVQLSPDGDGVTMDWDSRDGGFHPAVLDALFADVCEVLDQLAVGVVDVPAARAPEPVVRTRSMNGRLLHGRFLRAALDDADAPAVVHGDRTLTRGELCALAVRLAGGLPAGDAPVAVVLPPGPGQIAAQLAALLTGRAFVPLDPEWPGSRRRAVLDTVREAYAEEVPVVDDATLRAADAPGVPDAAGGSTAGDGAGDGAGDPGAWRDAVRRALAEPPLVDDLAYVIFTSGSTGTPKGVAVTHRQVCTTLDEMEDRLELTAADRVLAVSRPSFDLAVFNVFGVLGAGGAVVVPSCGTVPDPETWARDIRRHGVTVWNSVPAQLTILLDHLGDAATDAALPLRVVLVSGDRVPVDQPARVRALAPGVVVDALGGATEGSIWSIVHRCTPEEDGPAGTAADPSAGSTAGTAPARRSVPYGRALGHQAVWVLDRDGGRAAVGQRGEIVIAGDGVVEGYLGDPVRTAAAFGRHLGTGERCYRTGDVGRYLPDGEIEFCGRVDDGQVKIRGHRIELGEVEAGLRAVDGVADALAAVTGEGDRRELVAVVVPETADTSAAGTAAVPGTAGTAADTAPTSPAAALAAAVTARSRATELDDAERRDFRRIHDLVTDAALDAMTAQIARVTSASPDGTATRDAIVAGTGAQGHGTLMDRWIDELDRAGRVRCADGLLSVTDTDTAAGAATDTDTAAARWEEIHRLDDRLGYGRRQLDYLRTSLDELPGLLEGSVDPLSLLFPGGDMAVARASYGENRLASYLNGVCAAAVGHHARSLVAAGRTCRVLEIGAGVGGTTADVLAELADLTDPTDRPGPGVDYLFTDVSRYFTDAAAQEWPQVRTGLFDINTDPAEQGVEPGSVDVVLCANVLHNARDIDVALRRVAGMLAPGGVLVVIDSTATNAPLMASMEFKEGLGDAT
ncbi:AMP-binding protein, partial [Corynebacterium bovis]